MPMKILLSYSRPHYDPSLEPAAHQLWGSSANVLARSLHECLSDLGEVTYIDPTEWRDVAGQFFDVVVGQVAHFSELVDTIKPSTAILFTVNMHPRTRNRLLREFMVRERLHRDSLAGWDLVNEKLIAGAIERADYILCVGNAATYNSYIENGVPKQKIKTLNYSVGPSDPEGQFAPETSFVFVASELGLRKGLDVVLDLVSSRELGQRLHVDVVGAPTNSFYDAKLKEACRRHPGQITFHGWLDRGSEAYASLLRKSAFVLFPSIEEGQAGSLLDAMSHGAIPLPSLNAGIDFAPLGLMETKLNSATNRDLIGQALETSADMRRQMRLKTSAYYRAYHESFPTQLRDAVTGAIEGELYPRMSVVLPIFNKERTITEVLKGLHRTSKEYGNVDVQVIFDGCEDRSEEIVRNFFSRTANYEVSYFETPDIFETRTNNIGLRRARGKYCVLLQDDNVIHDINAFFEAAMFLDKNPSAAVLGGLAGVNFYPLGTGDLEGLGQIAMNENEVYWRQDHVTDPSLRDKVFEVDACMRGPLFIRKSFLEEFGYLDEAYAPFYQDDMDLCFRAWANGKSVHCVLMDVENRSESIRSYDKERFEFWTQVMKKNTDLFYSRWTPTETKDYSSIIRIRLWRRAPGWKEGVLRASSRSTAFVHRVLLGVLRRLRRMT